MINKEVAKLTATMQFALDKKSKAEVDKFTDTINKYEAVAKKSGNTAKKDWQEQIHLVSKYNKHLKYLREHDKTRANILEGQMKRIAKNSQSTKEWKRATLNLRDAYGEVKSKVDAANKSLAKASKLSTSQMSGRNKAAISGRMDWLYPEKSSAVRDLKKYYSSLEAESLKAQRTISARSAANVRSTNKSNLKGRLDWMYPQKRKSGPLADMSAMYSAEERSAAKARQQDLRLTSDYFRRNKTALKSLNAERAKTRDLMKKQVFETSRVIKAQGLSKEKTLHLRGEVAKLSRQYAKTRDATQYRIALRRVADQARNSEKPINKLRESMKRLFSTTSGAAIGSQFGGSIGAGLGAGIGQMSGPIGGLLSGGALVGGGAAKVGMELEGIKNSMRMITDSTFEARKQFEFISDMSTKMGTDISVSAEGFTKLAIAAGDKIERGDLQNLFQAFNKYSIAAGQSTFRYEKSLQALTQMLDKGGVYSEELRQQLSENLPGAIQLFAKAAGVSSEQLFKMMEQRQLKLEDISGSLAEVLNEAADKNEAYGTAVGQLSRQLVTFKNTMKMIGDAIYEAGLGDFLAQVVKLLGNIFKLFSMLTPLIGAILSPIAAFLNLVNKTIDRISGFLGIEKHADRYASNARQMNSLMMGRGIDVITNKNQVDVGATSTTTKTDLSERLENIVNVNVNFQDNDLIGLIDVRAGDAANNVIDSRLNNSEKRYGGGGRHK